jgi:HK97 family phage major capsid protein
MADDPNPEVELKTLVVDLKKAMDDTKKIGETAMTEMKNLGTITQETKDKADKALTEMNTLSERLTGVEQKMARGKGDQPAEQKSLGDLVVENDAVKALMESKSGQARVSIELKDITSGNPTVGAGRSPSTSLVVADRQGMVTPPMRQMVVRSLLTPGTTSSNAIEYAVETDDPNVTSAAVVSEGQLKPQSNVTFDLKSIPVRTIAHFMKASRQIMDDAPQLRSVIDGRLTYGLQFVEEGELLYGDGTGQHLFGIIPQATAYAAAFAPSLPTNIDTLRLASLQATLALYPASGFVMHPTDWGKIELTKDTQGRYIVGDPTGMLGKRLWNLPVVDTQAIQVGHFLTGAFQLGAQIFDRMSIEILISTENSDDFVRNFITIRGEERLTLAVYRPAAFIYGTIP